MPKLIISYCYIKQQSLQKHLTFMLSLSLLVPDNTLLIVRKAVVWKIAVIYVNLSGHAHASC